MSLLTMVQDAMLSINLGNPLSVIGSTDPNVQSALVLLTRAGKALSKRHRWQDLMLVASHTTVATESQGDINTIAPGYDKRLHPATMYNSTLKRRIYGPTSPDKWQRRKNTATSRIQPLWRIRGDLLLFLPVPTVDETVVFEYQDKNWVTLHSDSSNVAAFAADEDTTRLDEELLTLSLAWRMLKAKNLSYAEELATYEAETITSIVRDSGLDEVQLTGSRHGASLVSPFMEDGFG